MGKESWVFPLMVDANGDLSEWITDDNNREKESLGRGEGGELVSGMMSCLSVALGRGCLLCFAVFGI